jgi:MFS family permease
MLSIANASIYYAARHPGLVKGLFNSDAVYLPTVFADLFVKHGSIKDWFLTPAPYFFPDYVMFLFAYLVGSRPYIQILAFSLIQSFLTFIAIWFLVKQILKTHIFFTATIIFIVLLGLALSPNVPFNSPFISLLISGFHYGIFLISLIFLTLWIQHQEKKQNSLMFYFTMASLTFFSTLSDNLFILQVIAPLVGMALLDFIVERKFSFRSNFALFLITVFSFFGFLAYRFIITNPTRYPLNIGFNQILTRLKHLSTLFYENIFINPIYDALFLIYIGLVIYAFFQIKKGKMRLDPLYWLTLFSFLSLDGTLTLLLFVKDFPPTLRYFIPAFSLPVIIVFLFLNSRFSHRYVTISVIFSLWVVGSLSWNSFKLLQKNGFNADYYPDEVACIDHVLKKEHVHNGIAQYWDAKYIQNLSKLDLNIAQHFSDLGEMYWITSKKYFKSNYDFAIISGVINPEYKLSTELLIRLNGAPKLIQSCGKRLVYVYGKDKLRVKKIDPPTRVL